MTFHSPRNQKPLWGSSRDEQHHDESPYKKTSQEHQAVLGASSNLGSGRWGSVAKVRRGDTEIAAKQFSGDRHLAKHSFKNERNAYEAMQGNKDLTGHVPRYYGVDKHNRTLFMELILGKTLQSAEHLSVDLLRRCRDTLCTIINALHKAGIIHGDISPKNVMVRDGIEDQLDGPINGFVVLIDFNLAKTCDLSLTAKYYDWVGLKTTFSELEGRANNRQARVLLAQPNPPQEQLAMVVKDADPRYPDGVNHNLGDDILALSNPLPVLILAVVRAWKRLGRKRWTLDAIERYEPLMATAWNSDRRSAMLMKIDRFFCSGQDRLSQYPDIINQCIDALGPIDPSTLRLKYTYALQLEEHKRAKEAMPILLSMVHELRGVKSVVKPQENHVFAETLKPQDWIEKLEKKMEAMETQLAPCSNDPQTATINISATRSSSNSNPISSSDRGTREGQPPLKLNSIEMYLTGKRENPATEPDCQAVTPLNGQLSAANATQQVDSETTLLPPQAPETAPKPYSSPISGRKLDTIPAPELTNSFPH